MAVDLSKMRKLFKKGALQSAIVAPAAFEEGWELIIVRKDGKSDCMTIAKSTRKKIYKSLESVHNDAKRVGFDQVTTQLGALQVA